MSCTDPIADMLTVIRNGISANKTQVTVPFSTIKQGICKVLVDEGYIARFAVLDTKPARTIQIALKYGEHGESAIHTLNRVSTSGRRYYAGSKDLRPVMSGLGIQVVSTSQGILSDRACRQRKVGGEVLCLVK